MINSWLHIANYLGGKGYHRKIVVSKSIEHPLQVGAYVSTGVNRNQKSDFRLPLANGSGLHIREFENFYQAHLDLVEPSKNLLGHIVCDMPILPLLGVVLIKKFSQ